MRFAGIDIASETHVVAVVDEDGEMSVKAHAVHRGRRRLREAVRAARRAAAMLLVAMEATGHYWKNLFAALAAARLQPWRCSIRCAPIASPARTCERTKTDAIDALGIARFAAQKRPATTRLPDAGHRGAARTGAPARAAAAGLRRSACASCTAWSISASPNSPATSTASTASSPAPSCTTIPTAAAFHGVSVKRLAGLALRRPPPGRRRARRARSSRPPSAPSASITATPTASRSATPARTSTSCAGACANSTATSTANCGEHEVGSLLTTIDGIGPNTAARLIAELGDPADFRTAGALAAYVGVIPAPQAVGQAQEHPRRPSPPSATPACVPRCGCRR